MLVVVKVALEMEIMRVVDLVLFVLMMLLVMLTSW